MAKGRSLVIVYGAPFTGTATVAEQIARALPDKTALVRYDDLLWRWITVHDADSLAERAMVSMQVKLLVSHYLRNRYHVVVEGSYMEVTDGDLRSYEQEIDQLQALMRAMLVTALTVYLYLPEDVLRRRVEAARAEDAETVLRLAKAYRVRRGPGDLKFDMSVLTPEQVARTVLDLISGD